MALSGSLPPSSEKLAEALLGKRPDAVIPCAKSGNNKAFRVELGVERYLLKQYFHSAKDTRNRLASEWDFLQYAQTAGIAQVPTPIACDAQRNVALYSFVQGAPPTIVTEEMVVNAGVFAAALNADVTHASTLPLASEVCLSGAAYVSHLRHRLDRLSGVKHPIIDAMEARYADVAAAMAERYGDLQAALPDAQKCLSPSDFGFHNTLLDDAENLTFIDFEYAGWDDPAKMLCDFFLHPGAQVSTHYTESFIKPLQKLDILGPETLDRASILYGLLGLRWCCIMLNVFVPEWAARRRFADANWDESKAQSEQLQKAEHMLEKSANAPRWC